MNRFHPANARFTHTALAIRAQWRCNGSHSKSFRRRERQDSAVITPIPATHDGGARSENLGALTRTLTKADR